MSNGFDKIVNRSSIFVATDPEQPERILGFFTLSATSIIASDLPPEIARRVPCYPILASLIGRLAVDSRMAGRVLGGILLAGAIKKTIVAAEMVAMTVAVVDPIDEAAQKFYTSFGFH